MLAVSELTAPARPGTSQEPSPVRSNRPDRSKKARFFEFERLLIAKPVPTLAERAQDAPRRAAG